MLRYLVPAHTRAAHQIDMRRRVNVGTHAGGPPEEESGGPLR